MKEEAYEVEDLNYYIVTLELHGMSLFSSQSHPYPTGFVQTQLPVIHNYPLLLAAKGQACEESYVVGYNMLKKADNPANTFDDVGMYAYPAIVERADYKKILMSMSETEYVVYKPRTRTCVPLMVHHNMLAPGSLAKTVIISRDEISRELYLRLGVKRFGIWKATLKEASVEIKNGVVDIEFPFNVSDVKNVIEYALIMKHYAGDIAISGRASKAFVLRSGTDSLIIPIPLFIS
ncbi:MAG: hypothetical protein QW391_03140 [Nitrososphaerota archaeon]